MVEVGLMHQILFNWKKYLSQGKFENYKNCQTVLVIRKNALFYSSKILLNEKNTVCVKVEYFKNEIIRASRGFTNWAPTRALP